ncbi:DNA repair protein [Mesorhizobium erdmanii]|uniref:DUF488 domain-containing protein n=2 Tax=Mesorhizobium TaxID=68287 RepID=A0A3M9X0K3_9HYPH|nr:MULTISPECIES: DUF488 domain-containing protein [Mesorhizobium]RNJ41539.1 DUF488 domain-containing protein [Mesorhizobium japonicum]RXT37482.1 DNA repair protein [Mesorhizobium erdmanii]
MREDGDAKLPFFTIGHSDRRLDDFVELLRESGIELLADIRRMPMSRTNPQFNTDTLPGALAAFQISYEHIAALGGLRGKVKNLPPQVNGFWTNASFHNYADYALSAQFHEGLEHLLDEGRSRRCAIMCSEAVWWRCHRRIVTDYLIANGESVFHIMGEGRLELASLSSGAVIQPGRTVVYPTAHTTDE